MRSRVMNVAIYLDHAATSPMTPEVIAAYVSALSVVTPRRFTRKAKLPSAFSRRPEKKSLPQLVQIQSR